MIRFGIIGTNWITERFLEATKHLEDFALTSVYSRTEEKAKKICCSTRGRIHIYKYRRNGAK